jgi:hypothetical protein
MGENVAIPGFITSLKYLAAHKNWEGSFDWLAQFVHENAKKLNNAKALGALAATILGGILLFGNDRDDDDDDGASVIPTIEWREK